MWLHSNNLMHIEADKFLCYMPELEKLFLNGNFFNCINLRDYLALFTEFGVLLPSVSSFTRGNKLVFYNNNGKEQEAYSCASPTLYKEVESYLGIRVDTGRNDYNINNCLFFIRVVKRMYKRKSERE